MENMYIANLSVWPHCVPRYLLCLQATRCVTSRRFQSSRTPSWGQKPAVWLACFWTPLGTYMQQTRPTTSSWSHSIHCHSSQIVWPSSPRLRPSTLSFWSLSSSASIMCHAKSCSASACCWSRAHRTPAASLLWGRCWSWPITTRCSVMCWGKWACWRCWLTCCTSMLPCLKTRHNSTPTIMTKVKWSFGVVFPAFDTW